MDGGRGKIDLAMAHVIINLAMMNTNRKMSTM